MTKITNEKPLQPSNAAVAIEQVYRANWGSVLSQLNARLQDIQFSEDMLQEAVMSAMTTWSKAGIPDNPQGWLYRVAMNRAIDMARRFNKGEDLQHQLCIFNETYGSIEKPDDDQKIPDERLRMIFTCCHPAISQSAQIALTLRTLCGLKTAEIAHAFLIPEATLAQRLVRVKSKIKQTAIPYRVPANADLPKRLSGVLSVLYLIFNEGYYSSNSVTLIRGDLCDEALYLAKSLCELMPEQPEVYGLYALMMLHDSRREARFDDQGQLVMLPEQDRHLWDKHKIHQGLQYLTHASRFQQTGPYQLKAAISAIHTQSRDGSDTNWQSILLIYQELFRHEPTLVVALNMAVAESFANGPTQGLKKLLTLKENKSWMEKLCDYQPYYAALADVHARLGQDEEAIIAYQRAIDLSTNDQEISWLSSKIEGLYTT